MRFYFSGFAVVVTAFAALTSQNGEVNAQNNSAENFPPMFPFVISYDAPKNITNIAPQIDAPAGKHGFVRVKDGHFVTDNGAIRFWGTNLAFTANFPTHEQADKLADRLARIGYNCVRLHHMDTGENSLVGGAATLTELDKTKLDALDYLIAALEKRGIYVNINLHVGRWLDDRDGFPNRNSRPNYDKGIGNFEPRMIELQRKYAKDLLTHVNPYTKRSYANDPGVAMVEISNEDSIVSQWAWGNLDTLPEPYAGVYRKLWNDWLLSKYGATEKLRKAWDCKTVPLGEELCLGGDFTTDEAVLSRRLVMQTDEQSKAEMWVVDNMLKLKVAQMGNASWIPQIYYQNCSLKKDAPYTLTIRARADKETAINVGVRMAHAPWEHLGRQKKLKLTPDWQTFEMPFYATHDENNARIDVGGLTEGVIYEIDQISLRSGGAFGLKPEQTLESGSIAIVSPSDSGASPQKERDFVEFLFSVEENYWIGMYEYLKNDLRVQAPVAGTQLNYGSTQVQSQLDYCDNHSYWNHPSFPGRDWDMSNWFIRNTSLANFADTGTLTRLAANRVDGKPYTVSEYDHPYPNEYNAEGQPMIAALGRFQDWDGVFPFAYSHSNNFEPRQIGGFFDTISNTGKVAHSIACYAMFVRGDVSVAKSQYDVGVSPQREIDVVTKAKSPWELGWRGVGGDERLALLHKIAVDMSGRSTPNIPSLPKDQKRFASDTNQICWDMTREGRGFMTVDTPNTKLFSGFVPESPVKLGTLTLEMGKTRLGWCTVSIVSYDANACGEDGKAARLLVAATGKCVNTDMPLEVLGENRVTSGRNMGRDPVLCEGIPATLTLPADAERVVLYPLDQSGARKSGVAAKPSGDSQTASSSVVALSPDYQTVWYEIEIRERKR
ncbi:MAG: cellulase family glycosylhydrolase [Planctomycetaceae bacterium]|jgi:hypothetical protein|nr:cellulase family glycosylhydrolase [Planctomycetaceae bacterium]